MSEMIQESFYKRNKQHTKSRPSHILEEHLKIMWFLMVGRASQRVRLKLIIFLYDGIRMIRVKYRSENDTHFNENNSGKLCDKIFNVSQPNHIY